MLIKKIDLMVGYTNTIAKPPLHIYMYDRNIKLKITLLDYDFRFGSSSNSNFIEDNNITCAKAYLRAPNGDNYSVIDTNIVTERDKKTGKLFSTMEILIGTITNLKKYIGKWDVQIKLIDDDNSCIHLHPFSFYVHDLIGLTGNMNFDAYNDATPYDPKIEDPNLLSSSLFNSIEEKLSYIYSDDIFSELSIKNYKTENKNTIDAINEIKAKYDDLSSDINSLIDGTLDIEKYKKEHNIFNTATPSEPDNTPNENVNPNATAITSVEIINKQYNTINVGDYYLYKVTVEPKSSYSKRYKLIRWKSSNPNVARVNDTGKVTGVSSGEATITAYNRYNTDIEDKFTVKIGNFVPLNGILVSNTNFECTIGDSLTIPITLVPANATDTLYWESNNTAVASVDQTGKVTAMGNGTCTITVRSVDNPDKAASVMINVKKDIIRTVTINPVNYKVYVNDKVQLGCTTHPIDQEVVWSCNNDKVATITQDGLLTILSEGTFTVTCTLKSHSDIVNQITLTSEINYGIKPTKFTLNNISNESLVLNFHKEHTITYKFEPADADTRLNWEIEDTTIATIDGNGTIRTLKKGETTVSVTPLGNPSLKKTFKLTCYERVETITIENPPSELEYGSTYQCELIIEPALPEGEVIEWSSFRESVATVDSNGLVTCKGLGTTMIFAKCGNVEGSFTLTYKAKTPEKISFATKNVTIKAGETTRLTIVSDGYTDTSVDFSSDTPSVVTVDSSGNITGINPGEATITAVSKVNPSVECKCYVTVSRGVPKIEIVGKLETLTITAKVPNPQCKVEPAFYYLQNGSYYLDTGEMITSQDTNFSGLYSSQSCFIGNHTQCIIQWVARNQNVATIENGVITAKSPGTANFVITFKEADIDYKNKRIIPGLEIKVIEMSIECVLDAEGIKIIVPQKTVSDFEYFKLDIKTEPEGFNLPVKVEPIGIDPEIIKVHDPGWGDDTLKQYWIKEPGTYVFKVYLEGNRDIYTNVNVFVRRYVTRIDLFIRSESGIDLDPNLITCNTFELRIGYQPVDATNPSFKIETEGSSFEVLEANSNYPIRTVKKIGCGATTITCTYLSDPSIKSTLRLYSPEYLYVSVITEDPGTAHDKASIYIDGEKICGDLYSSSPSSNEYTYLIRMPETYSKLEFSDSIASIRGSLNGLSSAKDLFRNCKSLKRVINLEVNNATSISGMFAGCTSLKEVNLTAKNATDASDLFNGCTSLTKILKLDLENVKILNNAFCNCWDLKEIYNVNNNVNIANATDAIGLFNGCYSLVSINLENTENITDMSFMFNGCYSLESVAINTINVKNMNSMFHGCSSLTEIPSINFSNAISTAAMFSGCKKLKTVSNLDTKNVKDMSDMFSLCSSLTSVTNINTSSATTLAFMFQDCYELAELPKLDTTNVENFKYLYYNCSKMEGYANPDHYWNKSISRFNCEGAFYNCRSLDNYQQIEMYWRMVPAGPQ